MLVQDRGVPSPRRRRFSKNLDFSTWASENSSRLWLLLLLLAAAAAFLLLRSSSSFSASLLCLSPSSGASTDADARLPRPRISWSSIPPIPISSSSPFPSFRAERWIVVSVSSAPTEALRALARIKGWQLLAVGDSHTPPDWSVKGALFLSLDVQSQLGLRSLDFLPYHSRARKTVGYLFAIQRGARLIFDADDRAEVLSGDLASRFDVDLEHSHVLLQYSHADPNRTVVNPYVHFGQRSVWPRGLPLDRAGDVGPEEFYTETFGGKQFVQQGLSDGLPDVDAVFYFTRKTPAAAFDLRFDPDAPRVALPQGVMAPVNSLNTLFHSPAFWGLMMPVTVSSMASDVIRGYWLQRLLWEIEGAVAFYPPTIYRRDHTHGYPFNEEKDLHVNVGRLVDFLLQWRSNKHTLFERILDLSYAMAEEGFWQEQDVQLTAAWLQDLLAIGYRQPRLMSLEIDRQRAAIGHGDKREFRPKKLPSVHLGVEEIGTVNSEIANLIHWRKHFGNIVLVMYCNGPVERTALEWRLLYGRIFRTVVILSTQNNADLAVEQFSLHHAYKYLPKVFDQYSGAEGFLFLQDDTIINYWDLHDADKSKLWITDKVAESWITVPLKDNKDFWFQKQGSFVQQVVNGLPVHLQSNYKENTGDDKIIFCSSEIFYVPSRYTVDFSDLVSHVGELDLHHKIAVPMMFQAMDSLQNFESGALARSVFKTNVSAEVPFSSIYTADAPAVFPIKVQNEVEFIKLVRLMAAGDPLLKELV